MKLPYRIVYTILILALSAGWLAGCTTAQAAGSPLDAINDIRAKLGLPDLPLEFYASSVMGNSPDGDLPVMLFQDSQGRKYFVDPKTNQVVEIDARVILLSIPPDSPGLTERELREKAAQLAATAAPGFEAQAATLTYQAGFKEDLYFATWRNDAEMGAINHPFAQIGLHASGVLFAYYNTLSLR
jgi:hypothetical protein